MNASQLSIACLALYEGQIEYFEFKVTEEKRKQKKC